VLGQEAIELLDEKLKVGFSVEFNVDWIFQLDLKTTTRVKQTVHEVVCSIVVSFLVNNSVLLERNGFANRNISESLRVTDNGSFGTSDKRLG